MFNQTSNFRRKLQNLRSFFTEILIFRLKVRLFVIHKKTLIKIGLS